MLIFSRKIRLSRSIESSPLCWLELKDWDQIWSSKSWGTEDDGQVFSDHSWRRQLRKSQNPWASSKLRTNRERLRAPRRWPVARNYSQDGKTEKWKKKIFQCQDCVPAPSKSGTRYEGVVDVHMPMWQTICEDLKRIRRRNRRWFCLDLSSDGDRIPWDVIATWSWISSLARH